MCAAHYRHLVSKTCKFQTEHIREIAEWPWVEGPTRLLGSTAFEQGQQVHKAARTWLKENATMVTIAKQQQVPAEKW